VVAALAAATFLARVLGREGCRRSHALPPPSSRSLPRGGVRPPPRRHRVRDLHRWWCHDAEQGESVAVVEGRVDAVTSQEVPYPLGPPKLLMAPLPFTAEEAGDVMGSGRARRAGRPAAELAAHHTLIGPPRRSLRAALAACHGGRRAGLPATPWPAGLGARPPGAAVLQPSSSASARTPHGDAFSLTSSARRW
jgi:hypothetical protein